MTTYPINARPSARSGIARRLIAGTVLGAMFRSWGDALGCERRVRRTMPGRARAVSDLGADGR